MATVETDQDLLFGILALQNSLIEQPDLIAAFQCWSKERSRSMARTLVERGALTEDDRSMLDSLVRRHREKRGGAERGLAADPAPGILDDSRRRGASPDGDLEDSLPELSFRDNGDPSGIGNLTIGVGGGVEPDPLEPLDWSINLGQTTSVGGRFRLLRHHARGGIAVVFVALDSELQREVALKQIQPQHADDPASRARFLIEAEVTGRLEHPGVVPVYGLGTSDEGRPFYVMRFVRGQSPKEAIEKFRELKLANQWERARFDLALEAIKTFHSGVSEDVLLKEKQFDGLRTKLLRGATESLASHEQARVIRQRLADANPEVTQFQNDLAASYHDIGSIHRASGQATEALESYARARAICQKLADADPSDTQFQSGLAQSHNDIGYVQQETGHLAEALASLQQGRAI